MSLLFKDINNDQEIDDILLENLNFISSEDDMPPVNYSSNKNINIKNNAEKGNKNKRGILMKGSSSANVGSDINFTSDPSNKYKRDMRNYKSNTQGNDNEAIESYLKTEIDSEIINKLHTPEIIKRKGTIDYQESNVKIIPYNVVIDVRDIDENIKRQKEELERLDQEIEDAKYEEKK
eukprot:CAMPEP_0170528144 /NCGR_PEP_ID=MMETSP0209-20121228/13652_1 /TAXON_ID=665100 ORGANISM="Litonotus pictus, Strain P1" /NCGR_SAMPLE_ID=MMETSP0209 /ASSEMBLY_ACC=CAM_ASM_000301 /LENGTH=177 /DNA_ID=CAMNT_0010819179 /DNA_START=123 /DNA_END=653 /DNA_ORIENTATION=-